MKYVLRNLNCVQETDSEERKKELEAKGYKVVAEKVPEPEKETEISESEKKAEDPDQKKEELLPETKKSARKPASK